MERSNSFQESAGLEVLKLLLFIFAIYFLASFVELQKEKLFAILVDGHLNVFGARKHEKTMKFVVFVRAGHNIS